MSFCEHCEGQRFDRARVLRTLRRLRNDVRGRDRCTAEAIDAVLQRIRTLDIPHLDVIDEMDDIVH
jgi:hypothetical protein